MYGNLLAMLSLVSSVDNTTHRYVYVHHLEYNKVHNEEGEVTFCQFIFWELDRISGEYHVRDWCPAPRKDVILDSPLRLRQYLISFDSLSVTMTRNDPELDDRRVWPVEWRKEFLNR